MQRKHKSVHKKRKYSGPYFSSREKPHLSNAEIFDATIKSANFESSYVYINSLLRIMKPHEVFNFIHAPHVSNPSPATVTPAEETQKTLENSHKKRFIDELESEMDAYMEMGTEQSFKRS